MTASQQHAERPDGDKGDCRGGGSRGKISCFDSTLFICGAKRRAASYYSPPDRAGLHDAFLKLRRKVLPGNKA